MVQTQLIFHVSSDEIDKEPESKAQTNAGTGYLVVLKDVKVLFVLGCVVFGQGVQAALEPVLPVYLRDKWGLSSGWIGAIIGNELDAKKKMFLIKIKVLCCCPSQGFHQLLANFAISFQITRNI